jgi:serine/threonine protein kinase
LGKGSNSVVRLGKELKTGKRVALKVLNMGNGNAVPLDHFSREIEILRILGKHPNIIQLDAVLNEEKLTGAVLKTATAQVCETLGIKNTYMNAQDREESDGGMKNTQHVQLVRQHWFNRPILVMSPMCPQGLFDVVCKQNGPVENVEVFFDIASQLASVIRFCHHKGIFHRFCCCMAVYLVPDHYFVETSRQKTSC